MRLSVVALLAVAVSPANAFTPPQMGVMDSIKSIFKGKQTVGVEVDSKAVRREKMLNKINEVFPGAVSNQELVARVTSELSKYGFDSSNTLICASVCCDEVNRPLPEAFGEVYSYDFSMGGLAGFPFAGVTGFGAMASHIPENGFCLVIYGPHVGVDGSGSVGKVDRRGIRQSGACCGSAVAASNYVRQVYKGEVKITGPSNDPLDAEQSFVKNMLMPYAQRLETAEDPMVELPYAAYESIDDMMQKIVKIGSSSLFGTSKIAMLGGLQINTAPEFQDYFLPLRFDIRDNSARVIEDLIWTKK